MRGITCRSLVPGKQFSRRLAAPVFVVVVLLLSLVLAPGARAAGKYKTLYRFTGGSDGGSLQTALIFDGAGNLYGTTQEGGDYLAGTVFKLTPNADGTWTESVLHSFCSLTNCSDGAFPNARLIFDQTGNLYGTTPGGGILWCSGGITYGCGVVFKLTHHPDGSWTENVLYKFCPLTNCGDGWVPTGGLIFDEAGSLYGTTYFGGNLTPCSDGCGVVFRLTPKENGTWRESVLHTFCAIEGCSDGASPEAGLTIGAGGHLYGTTQAGGRAFGGVAFRMTPNSDGSWTEDVLHSFGQNSQDGRFPSADLIFDSVGNLYGTTFQGGSSKICSYGCGTVFKLMQNPDGRWTEKVLHTFKGGRDGGYPFAGLKSDQPGSVYGTTSLGGNLALCSGLGCGVVFRLSPHTSGGWRETVLHSFFDRPGACPQGGVIFDTVGKLYGTTAGDRCADENTTFGSVFQITP